MSLTISDADYDRIITVIGYPITSVSDLGLTDDQVKSLLILPVLTDVFSVYFPVSEDNQYTISSSFSIDFPSAETFGVTDARLNTYPYSGAVKVANPLINQLNIKSGGTGRRMWGTENDYGYSVVGSMERAERASMAQSYKGFHVKVNQTDRVLEGYTNIYGALSVTWASYTEDFNDVPHRFHMDMIRRAQAEVLRYCGRLRSQGVSDLPETLQGRELEDEADKIIEEVEGKWQKYSKVAILRG